MLVYSTGLANHLKQNVFSTKKQKKFKNESSRTIIISPNNTRNNNKIGN